MTYSDKMTDEERRTLAVSNVWACLLHTLSAIAGTILVQNGNPTVPAYLPLFEYNVNGTNGAPFFIPKPKLVFNIGTLTPLLMFAWITAGFHVLYVANLYSLRVQVLQEKLLGGGGVNPLRWVEFSYVPI